MIISAFLNLFKKKPDGYATPWMTLHVVHAVALEGLTADQAYGMRARFLRAGAIDFSVTPSTNGTAYSAYFRDTEQGRERAPKLIAELRELNAEMPIPAFGIGTGFGECLIVRSAEGGFDAPPVGEAVTEAKRAAMADTGVSAPSS
jgi:hypothetical protein